MNEWFYFIWLLGSFFTMGFVLAFNTYGWLNAIFLITCSIFSWPFVLGYAISKYIYMALKGLETLLHILVKK